MPTTKKVTEFIKAVEERPHYEVIEQFYSKNATMQENQLPARVGKEQLIANEKGVYKNIQKVHSKCVLPFFIKDNQVIIRWWFKFDWKNGTYSEIEEVTCQQWENELIVKEQFFYDPKQFSPKQP